MDSKYNDAILHARERMQERFGEELDKNTRKSIISAIHNKNSSVLLLEKQPPSRTLWAVFYNDRLIPVVYDCKLKTLVTIMPEQILFKFRAKVEDFKKKKNIANIFDFLPQVSVQSLAAIVDIINSDHKIVKKQKRLNMI
jgi:hypothetical protein